MDPLRLLRDYNSTKQLDKVAVVGDRVVFGDNYSFSYTSFTAFKKSGGDYYTLDALLCLLHNRTLTHAEYLNATSKAKVNPVSMVDRKVGLSNKF